MPERLNSSKSESVQKIVDRVESGIGRNPSLLGKRNLTPIFLKREDPEGDAKVARIFKELGEEVIFLPPSRLERIMDFFNRFRIRTV